MVRTGNADHQVPRLPGGARPLPRHPDRTQRRQHRVHGRVHRPPPDPAHDGHQLRRVHPTMRLRPRSSRHASPRHGLLSADGALKSNTPKRRHGTEIDRGTQRNRRSPTGRRPTTAEQRAQRSTTRPETGPVEANGPHEPAHHATAAQQRNGLKTTRPATEQGR